MTLRMYHMQDIFIIFGSFTDLMKMLLISQKVFRLQIFGHYAGTYVTD